MRMIRVFLILAAVLCLLTTCCDECKDCPVCPEPEAEEHLFYIAPKQGNMVKIFSVEREAFIDSLVVDSIASNAAMKIHVIGDDSLLAASGGARTYIIDLATKEIVESFNGRKPTFSRDSRYYFYFNYIDEENYQYELHLYPEHTLIFFDRYGGDFASFCNQSEYLTYQYYESAGDPIELGFYSILGGAASHSIKTWNGHPVTFFQSQAIGRLKKTFIDAATYNFFGVCDFNSDTLRSLKSFSFMGTTNLVVSPDDKYVFFTDYGMAPFGYMPTRHIFVWDAEAEDSVAAIAYQGIDMSNWLVITHDSKYLLARPYNIMNDYTTFCLIDAKGFQVIGVYDCGFLPGNVTAKYCARNGILY